MTNTIGFARLATLTMAVSLIMGAAIGSAQTPLNGEFEEIVPPDMSGLTMDLQSNRIDVESLTAPLPEEAITMWDSHPVGAESSGTWRRRGLWSAEVDAVVMVRKWDRQGATFAFDGITGSTFNPTGLERQLDIGRSRPGSEASARLRLGRFLFRDDANRDHTMDFIVFGGGEFFHSCELESINPNGIVIPAQISLFESTTFDGASTSAASYASRFNSFELNYQVTSRMRRDRMVLNPDGGWVRQASPGITFHGLAGMRYFQLDETVVWTADDIINADVQNVNGEYIARTGNDMFGFQGGGGLTYETNTWSITMGTKMGILMNDAIGKNSVRFRDGVTGDDVDGTGFTNNNREGTLPFLIQSSVLGRYHIKPNLSLRFGYEMMFVTAIAEAPHQVNFAPDPGKVTVSGDSFYHGITMGTELYW